MKGDALSPRGLGLKLRGSADGEGSRARSCVPWSTWTGTTWRWRGRSRSFECGGGAFRSGRQRRQARGEEQQRSAGGGGSSGGASLLARCARQMPVHCANVSTHSVRKRPCRVGPSVARPRPASRDVTSVAASVTGRSQCAAAARHGTPASGTASAPRSAVSVRTPQSLIAPTPLHLRAAAWPACPLWRRCPARSPSANALRASCPGAASTPQQPCALQFCSGPPLAAAAVRDAR